MKRLLFLSETESHPGNWTLVSAETSPGEKSSGVCHKFFAPPPGVQDFRVTVSLEGGSGGGLTRAGSYTFQAAPEAGQASKIGYGGTIIAASASLAPPADGRRELVCERSRGVVRMTMGGGAPLETRDPHPGAAVFDMVVSAPAGACLKKLLIEGSEAEKWRGAVIHPSGKYNLCVCMDFYDDLIKNPWTERTFREAMEFFASSRVRRVYFIDMGDRAGGLWDVRGRSPGLLPSLQRNIDETHAAVGEFLPACARAARAAGLELFAVLKINEQAFPFTAPFGSERAERFGKIPRIDGMIWWSSRFAAENPGMRLERRPVKTPGQRAVRSIALAGSEGGGESFVPALWVSRDNAVYTPYSGPVTVTRREKNILELGGLNITEPFLALGAKKGRLGNTPRCLAELRGADGSALPLSFGAAWQPGLPEWPGRGFIFDYPGGRVSGLDDYVWLEEGAPLGVAVGEERYLAGILCEAYPEVQDFWMSETARCLAAGADGVDFRFSSHSRTMDLDAFGFNPPLLEAYKARYGEDVSDGSFDPERMRLLRGGMLTGFLRRAGAFLKKSGKRLITHVDGDDFPPSAGRHSGAFSDWRAWLAEGIPDEITLCCDSARGRSSPLIIAAAREKGVPVSLRPHFSAVGGSPADRAAVAATGADALAGGADGFIIYESASFTAAKPGGGIAVTAPWLIEELAKNAK